jgi:hypothetical protein
LLFWLTFLLKALIILAYKVSRLGINPICTINIKQSVTDCALPDKAHFLLYRYSL